MARNQRGFTMVELMVASTVFSVILLVATGTVVRFSNNFQKGLTETTTQNASRSVVDTVAQTLQFSGSHYSSGTDTVTGRAFYCIGSTRYSYVLGRQLEDDVNAVLTQDLGTGNGCAGPAASTQEMLSPHMRLAEFTITPRGNLYIVKVKVAYGSDDLMCVQGLSNSCDPNNHAVLNIASLSTANLANVQCKGIKGSEFCAVRELSTTVQRRL